MKGLRADLWCNPTPTSNPSVTPTTHTTVQIHVLCHPHILLCHPWVSHVAPQFIFWHLIICFLCNTFWPPLNFSINTERNITSVVLFLSMKPYCCFFPIPQTLHSLVKKSTALSPKHPHNSTGMWSGRTAFPLFILLQLPSRLLYSSSALPDSLTALHLPFTLIVTHSVFKSLIWRKYF